jgi:aconitate hydratase
MASEPLGTGKDGKPVFLKDVWPTQQEVNDAVASCVDAPMFASTYANVFRGDERWGSLPTPEGQLFSWDAKSTYVKLPPYFENLPATPDAIADLKNARCLAVLGDSVTTDHISPAGDIPADSPAGKYLLERGVPKEEFNSYGARRGNHELMMRGTFANVRLKNLLAPGTEGGVTIHLPTARRARSSTRRRGTRGRGSARDPGGQGVRLGLVARLGAKGRASRRGPSSPSYERIPAAT